MTDAWSRWLFFARRYLSSSHFLSGLHRARILRRFSRRMFIGRISDGVPETPYITRRFDRKVRYCRPTIYREIECTARSRPRIFARPRFLHRERRSLTLTHLREGPSVLAVTKRRRFDFRLTNMS